MIEMIFGGVATASFVAGLIFLRYWRLTGDRFFILFALSFWLEACNRCRMVALGAWHEDDWVSYTIRFVSYVLILIAILVKNRPRSS